MKQGEAALAPHFPSILNTRNDRGTPSEDFRAKRCMYGDA